VLLDNKSVFNYNVVIVKEKDMRKIKEVRLELDKLREDYESKVALLKAEITSIRESRGYKLKEKSYEPYYEAGRSTMPTPSGGMGSVL
jgi:hypothetical protein